MEIPGVSGESGGDVTLNRPWREMTRAELERAYSPSQALPDRNLTPFLERYESLSARTYSALAHIKTPQYDLFLPEGPGPFPLLIFFHGGYWQQLGKRDAAFPAMGAVARGVAFATVDYTLAPKASLDQIVEECVEVASNLHTDVQHLNLDPQKFILAGSSAGAHLAASVCTRLAGQIPIAGTVLLSGVYDLEPLVETYINDAVGMDIATAKRNSPILENLSAFPPSIVTWGEVETDAFKRQSRAFAEALPDAQTFETPGRNHFDIVEDLTSDSLLGRAVFDLFDHLP